MNKLKAFFEQLRNLDPNDPGDVAAVGPPRRDRPAVRARRQRYTGISFKAKRRALEARAKETELWTTLETKAKKAANPQAYKDPCRDGEAFGAMLRQLAEQDRVPTLGRHFAEPRGGLEEKLFQPGGRESQGVLRRAPDPHPADRRVPRNGRLRERHRSLRASSRCTTSRSHLSGPACRAVSPVTSCST
jgi:hypothetical protein